MANKKISELTLFPTANSTDQIPVNRLGMNGKVTVASLGGFSHYIGESYGGGVIFHLWKDNAGVEHGLICSIVDQSSNSAFSNIDNILIGTTTFWDGQTNTNLIKTQSGASLGAWKFADNYSYSGFTDWYLPSIDELNLLHTNAFNTNKTLSTIVGAQLLSRQYYWSSTEYDNITAYTYNFITNETAPINKAYTFWVRAIRKF